ncbi:hypothetical protein ADK53_27970 [Streptomyces sp. WM6373]|uniref:hypothetical protein n=1 Tax=Streptomyces TaxID=1883 RepID=UPI0006ADDFD6|nr:MULTISPECIES: hypothetical protein [unclassified Streptomyces]KOU30723.1 hypothetical protein ADK53_27970 [Streptomyces sp. WM6373]KOU62453.1 hypothetical protein ADK96_26635 [Streptomyces sp. IGB124]KOU72392.1 hypothetical protein ADK61_27210 [Streptomyces sp. XY66]KOV18739.1 hypothetical protein ADK90_20020 [Streptomyces sp. XY413]KOV34291.1 hypothetical protein ADK97_15675 [Streptomyces sp. H021]
MSAQPDHTPAAAYAPAPGAAAELCAMGVSMADAGPGMREDMARLSPLKTARINFLGRYLFNRRQRAAQGLRRPYPLGPVAGGQ